MNRNGTPYQDIRQRLKARRERHQAALQAEAVRLAEVAAELGVERVILFGSALQGNPGLASDLDLLVVWDTPSDLLTRTVELYRQLRPRVPVDLLVYTPQEMIDLAQRPFVRNVLKEGRTLYEA